MNNFRIELHCANCNGTKFEAFDEIKAKEKDVLGLARTIAAQGHVNLPAFKTKCVNCGVTNHTKITYILLK